MHPSSTLFPYTSLFRSIHRAQLGNAGGAVVCHPDIAAVECHSPRGGAGRERSQICAVACAELCNVIVALVGDPDVDRKSTRLNSSHVESSYAVFCLKKK